MDILRRYLSNEFNDHDYREDGPENIYFNQCCECKVEFFGYKGRLKCKVCQKAYDIKIASMSPNELEIHQQQLNQALIDAHNKIKPHPINSEE